MAKKAFHILFSIFLSYLTIELFSQLYRLNVESLNFLQSLFYATLLNLYLLGVFAFIGFSFSTYKLFPKSYFMVKNPDSIVNTYKIFGVKYFRFILMLLFWGKRKNRKKYFGGSRKDFKHLIVESKRSEFGHLIALILLLLFSIPFLFKSYYLLFVLINTLSFIINFYPVIIQRHHRMRIQRINSN